MKISPVLKAIAAGGLAVLALSACATNETGTAASASDTVLAGELVGAGASSQDAAQQGWIAGFQTMHEKVTVNYDPSGSGAGRESFQQGAAAFAGSDRAFKIDEISAGPFQGCAAGSGIVEIPAYISPIAVVFSLEGSDGQNIGSLNMDAATVAKIFMGTVTNWNDPQIADQNSEVALPDQAITAVHRSDKSGTTGNFTDYLSAAASDVWTDGSVEEWPFQNGEAAQGTSGVVDAVTNGVGTIGYADASRAGDLGTIKIKVGDEFVAYSPEAAAAIVDHSPIESGRAANDLAISIDRTSTEAGVYPIVLVSYLIGCEEYATAGNAGLVREYFSYVTSPDGQDTAAETAGSAPISAELRSKIEPAIAAIK